MKSTKKPYHNWIFRALVATGLTYATAHVIVTGALVWGPTDRHDATVLGQMIAVALFPALAVIAFGAQARWRGPLLVCGCCLLATLATLIVL